ncbi:MAG: Na+/H+ antiporter subunit E [Gammaproteobacteria bacterium]
MTTHSPVMVVPRGVTLALCLFILWILLSGHWDPWLMGVHFGSVLLVVGIALRMDIADHEGHPIHIGFLAVARYWVWLLVAVVKSALDVSRRILDPKLPISPHVIAVRSTQGDDVGHVIYAKSITLTPGTVCIDVRDGFIHVHALTEKAARDLQRGHMDRRIRRLDRSG